METCYKTIDEAVFELPDIERVKRSILGPICAFVIGVGLVACCYVLPSGDENENLFSSLLLAGCVLAAVGVIVAAARFFSKRGVPCFAPTGRIMKRHETFYDEKHLEKIRKCLESGDFEAMSEIPKAAHSSVILVSYCDSKSEIAVCQIQRYVPHYFAPVHEPIVFYAPKAGQLKSVY